MVWALKEPDSFGRYWPSGDFEGTDDRGRQGWFTRLENEFLAAASAEEKDAFGGDNVVAARRYALSVVHKFRNEVGCTYDRDMPVLTPIEAHEPPRFYELSRSVSDLGDIISLTDMTIAVSASFKEIVEELEPGVHQFFSLEMRMPNRAPLPTSYYMLVVGRFISSFAPQLSEPDAYNEVVDGKYAHKESKKGFGGLALRAARFEGCHLWRERDFIYPPVCISDELHARMTSAQLRWHASLSMKLIGSRNKGC